MIIDPVSLIVNAVSAAAGALLAGYAGVRFGLMRVRSERAFDQRLGWYKEMLAALHSVAKLLDEHDSPAFDVLQASDPLHLRIQRFDLAVAEARAYATEQSLRAIAITADAFQALPRVQQSDDPKRVILLALNSLRDASEALCDDIRGHLGLEETHIRSWPYGALQRIPATDSTPRS